MKTKNSIIFFTSIVILLYSCCNFAQNNLSEDVQIRDMLKVFYTIYMTQIDKGPMGTNNEDSIRRKYCTARLLEAMANDEELVDYDILIAAQDANVNNLKTLSIRKNEVIPNGYVVTYEDGATKDQVSIRLTVIKEKGVYKIDSVESYSGKKYGGGS